MRVKKRSYSFDSSKLLIGDSAKLKEAGIRGFLEKHFSVRHCFQSYMSSSQSGVSIQAGKREIFTSLMILDLIGKRLDKERRIHLLKYILKYSNDGYFTFYEDSALAPPRLECIALAFESLLHAQLIEKSLALTVLGDILENTDKRGCPFVHLDPDGKPGEVDPVACALFLSFAYEQGVGMRVKSIEDYLWDWLKSEAYLRGTRVYPSPDTFLYFMTKAVVKEAILYKRFKALLNQAIKRRLEKKGGVVELAMRALFCRKWGIECKQERLKLTEMKRADDSWPSQGWMKIDGKWLGSDCLSTALVWCVFFEK